MNLGWGLIWVACITGGIPACYGMSFNSLCIISGGSGDATWSFVDGDHGARIPTTPQLVAAVLLLRGGERTYTDRVELKWTSTRDIVIDFRISHATGKEMFSNFVFLIYFGMRYFMCI